MLRAALLLFSGLFLAACFRANRGEIGAQLIKIAPAREAEWSALIASAKNPPPPFVTKIEFVTEPKFSGKNVEEVLATLPKDYPYSFLFIADERALVEEGFPCYCIDLSTAGNPHFRVAARHVASVENNLSLANMDFSEFAEAAKRSGVFRGF